MSITLRDYQVSIVEEARTLMNQGVRSILIQSPTGSGKTALTAHMLMSAASKQMDSFFIVHRRELIKQSVLTFDKVGVNHGIIAHKFPHNVKPPVQIASIYTLLNRYHRFRKPKLIIWDEAHHLGAAGWTRIFRAFPDSFHIGLTATPERLDGKGLKDYFTHMIKGPAVSELITAGYLSPYRAFAPATPNLASVHTRMGDYAKSELASALDKPAITGNAITEYKRRAMGKRNVVFCVNVNHSKHVVEQFNSEGIPAAHVDGDSTDEHRDSVIKQFESGEIKVLSNCELFGEGFDLPAIECVTLLRPTQSLGLYLQQVGRALRIHPGKSEAIILDHAGNIERHGLPDDHREWTLEGRDLKRPKTTGPAVRICPMCFAAIKPSPVCGWCGHFFETEIPELNEKEGDLVELTKEEIQRRQKEKTQERGRAATLPELIELGKKRGYKNPYGWAKAVFNARQRKRLGGV